MPNFGDHFEHAVQPLARRSYEHQRPLLCYQHDGKNPMGAGLETLYFPGNWAMNLNFAKSIYIRDEHYSLLGVLVPGLSRGETFSGAS